MGQQWVLCECGFNQQLFEGGSKARGGSVREIACFSSLPQVVPQVVVSSKWDCCHVYVKVAGDGAGEGEGGAGERKGTGKDSGAPGEKKGGKSRITTFTRGRWKALLDELQEQLSGETIMRVVETGDQILVKTDSGGFLGVDQDKQVTRPKYLEKVSSIHVQGGGVTYMQLTDGLVYVCTPTSNMSTTPLLPGVVIKQVACGSDHVLLLSREGGRVWSGGLNHRGQLGHGDIQSRPRPSLIEALDGISFEAISCGNWHNLALSKYGDVYSWGWNVDQQLGHSADTATVATPTLVDVGEEVNFRSVACGCRHSAAISECGVLYTWGWNTHGQLGPRNTLGVGPAPITRGAVSWVHCLPWSTLFLVKK